MQNILEIKEIKKTFYKNRIPFPAVDGISFAMERGECLGLVGESGCGKSTTARIITHLTPPDEGSVLLDGEETRYLKGRAERELYRKVQMVFQSPQDSFDPRRTLGDGIMEGMRNRGMSRTQAKERLYELLWQVELEQEFACRCPHEVSGGQCQRAAIARALLNNPQIVLADEPTANLDPDSTEEVMELFRSMTDEGRTVILSTHNQAMLQRYPGRTWLLEEGYVTELDAE